MEDDERASCAFKVDSHNIFSFTNCCLHNRLNIKIMNGGARHVELELKRRLFYGRGGGEAVAAVRAEAATRLHYVD